MALEVTGRTRADLLKGGTREEAVESCNKFFEQDGATPEHRCIIGHNIQRFDRNFLFALWESVGKTFPANLWLDTLPATKEYAKTAGIQSSSFNLENALIITGCNARSGQHNAIVDTQNNYILWNKLEKYGVDFLKFTQRRAHEVK
jgi:DNA polymerase III epsilon subunit-like protein